MELASATDVVPVTGVAAATRATFLLDANEAHIISMLRAKKYTSTIEFLRAVIAAQ
jgi:hypothetical protein